MAVTTNGDVGTLRGARDIRYEELVRPDRVHGSLYRDPQVLHDELERIWYRTWVYIGHESEIREPGDYARKVLGMQPVILTRDGDGEVHVLLNRCSHVGNLICHEIRGRTKAFRCPYHGWTFGVDGSCMSVPFNKAYEDVNKESRPLARPPRIASYRGFVFASMTRDVPDLMEHLGNAALAIDQLCDLSPAGEIELTAGWLRHLTRSNWKIGYEGLVDGYHPTFVHQSLVRIVGDSYNFDASDNTYERARIRDLGNGHADLDFRHHYRATGAPFQWMTGTTREKLPEYVKSMEESYGAEKANQLLVDGPPHTIIFPNLFLGELFLMTVEPLNTTRHVELVTPVQWKGAPDLNRRNIIQTHAAIGPAGMVLADDGAMFERNQHGLEALEPEWLMRDRGKNRTEAEENGVTYGKMTDDNAILGFWGRYRELMCA
jgi:phenylpropionate dioxygenase-like ring-hydroxylating dioxygenase large terminal subunit